MQAKEPGKEIQQHFTEKYHVEKLKIHPQIVSSVNQLSQGPLARNFITQEQVNSHF